MREDTDALRLVVREAHEVIKDLRTVIREATEVRKGITDDIAAAVTGGIDDAVKIGLEGYSAAISVAIEDATEAVYQRFDTIAETLLGITERDKREGNVSIADQAKLVRSLIQNGELNETEQDVLAQVRAQAKRRFE